MLPVVFHRHLPVDGHLRFLLQFSQPLSDKMDIFLTNSGHKEPEKRTAHNSKRKSKADGDLEYGKKLTKNILS